MGPQALGLCAEGGIWTSCVSDCVSDCVLGGGEPPPPCRLTRLGAEGASAVARLPPDAPRLERCERSFGTESAPRIRSGVGTLPAESLALEEGRLGVAAPPSESRRAAWSAAGGGRPRGAGVTMEELRLLGKGAAGERRAARAADTS